MIMGNLFANLINFEEIVQRWPLLVEKKKSIFYLIIIMNVHRRDIVRTTYD